MGPVFYKNRVKGCLVGIIKQARPIYDITPLTFASATCTAIFFHTFYKMCESQGSLEHLGITPLVRSNTHPTIHTNSQSAPLFLHFVHIPDVVQLPSRKFHFGELRMRMLDLIARPLAAP